MDKHETINYLELPAKSISAAQAFFGEVFQWSFEAYGPDYLAFSDSTIDGGFYQSELSATQANGSALVVFYSDNLAATQSKIVAAGGMIVTPEFSFPGGSRFHFSDPNGNEYAVWKKTE